MSWRRGSSVQVEHPENAGIDHDMGRTRRRHEAPLVIYPSVEEDAEASERSGNQHADTVEEQSAAVGVVDVVVVSDGEGSWRWRCALWPSAAKHREWRGQAQQSYKDRRDQVCHFDRQVLWAAQVTVVRIKK